ncbi:hypothetical protein J6590_029971 [Homalodisca vitripennis]|nr:hypothetical protein J6590_029971 [Homalodisca vitripennis]
MLNKIGNIKGAVCHLIDFNAHRPPCSTGCKNKRGRNEDIDSTFTAAGEWTWAAVGQRGMLIPLMYVGPRPWEPGGHHKSQPLRHPADAIRVSCRRYRAGTIAPDAVFVCKVVDDRYFDEN